ncbi:unnamed protein product [Discula destructiva]
MVRKRLDQTHTLPGVLLEKLLPPWARDLCQQVFSKAPFSWALSALFLVLPSFVASYFRPNLAARKKPLHETAYLDGLRGVAAFIVYLHHTHMMYKGHGALYGYGSNPEAFEFLQLPFVRLITAGQASVSIFFVISGYVLSLKTLGHIYENQPEKVLSTLSSSVLRRGARLYLPFAVMTLFLAINAQTDWPFPIEFGTYRLASFNAQMTHWSKVMAASFNPLPTIGVAYSPTDYIGVAWTLPIEFTGSMIVFMMLLALAESKRWTHALVVFVVGVYGPLAIGGTVTPYTALFCAGMLMAELGLVLPPATSSRYHGGPSLFGSSGPSRHVQHVVHTVLLAVALFLLSSPPIGFSATVGLATLSTYIPAVYNDNPSMFTLALGSMLLVLLIMYAPAAAPASRSLPSQRDGLLEEKEDVVNAPLLHRLFTNRIAQYLGRISFSLYLWHEPVKAVVCTEINARTMALRATYAATAPVKAAQGELGGSDREYYWDFFWILIPGLIWTTMWVVWVSDLFCRAVDEPSVRFARRMSRWMES